ncbi:MAG: glycosyltransferase [Thermoplasmataceae archaeon]
MTKLNLGCGEKPITGFINIDVRSVPGVDLVCDVFNKLPFDDNSVETIVSNHILEHINYNRTSKVLEEWYRVLDFGGEIRIRVPNLAYLGVRIAIKNFLNLRIDDEVRIVYGGQDYEGNTHFSGFTKSHILSTMREVGFTDFTFPVLGRKISYFLKKKGYGLELEIVAKKPFPLAILAFTEDSWNIVGFYSAFINYINKISMRTDLMLVKCKGASSYLTNINGEVIELPSTLTSDSFSGFLGSSVKKFVIFRRLFKILMNSKNNKIKYIISNYDSSFIFLLLLAKLLGKRFLVVIWETKSNEHMAHGYYLKEKLKIWFASFSDLVMVSNQINRNYLSENWINESKIKVFSPPIDAPEKLSTSRDVEMLCTIGVIEQKKHINEVIKVVEILREIRNKDFQLFVIGDGSLLDEYKNHYSDSYWVHFLGQVSTDVKWNILSKSIIYCTCSDSEGFGIPVAEALSVGTPVVAYRLPVYDELWGNAIKQVKYGDMKSMALAIDNITSSEDKWNMASIEGLNSFKHKYSEDIGESFVKILKGL